MNCTVEQNQRYRARIDVPFFKRPFASESVIAGTLAEAGFVEIMVKADPDVSGRYWAWGRWPLASTSRDIDEIKELVKA